MRKKLLKKHRKKFTRDEEDDEDEIEENDQDAYEEDGFVVPDGEMEEGGYQPMNMDVDPEAPDAEIESELASSDYDIMDEKIPSKKLKKLHKGKRELEEEEFPRSSKPEKKKKSYASEEREDIDNFIERDEYVKESGEQYEGRVITKSLAHNIFSLDREEDDNEDERINVQKKNLEQQLTSIYGREELEEEYVTEKDKKIKALDYPERLLRHYSEEQLSTLGRDLDLEAEWIFENLRTFSSNVDNIGNIKKKITLVLEYYKKEFFDIPFIAIYRKMCYEPELTVKDIWKIFELDKEWTKLSDYKQNVKKQWSTIIKFIEPKKVEFMERKYIDNAKSITDLKDAEAFITFTREFHRDEIENEYDNVIHRPHKVSILEKVKDNKIHDFARKFAMTSHDMAINLEIISSGDSKNRLIPPPDPNIDPAHLSFKYIGQVYDQEIKVMTIACKYLAIEMVSYPFIRSYARSYFKKNCTLSTEPTEEGKNELNVFHRSFRVKRIEKKPVETFTNDLFMDIAQCEMKNLITVKIECEEDLKDISERLNFAYNFDSKLNFSSSNISQDNGNESLNSKWRIMREEAIRMLVIEYLFPEFVKEIRAELMENAENFVISECCLAFNNLLLTGPYKKQKLTHSDDDLFKDDESPKVMSFIYDSSKNEVYCAIIDQNGELIDYNVFNYLANKPSKNTKSDEKELYYEDQNKIKDMIEKYTPDLIVIGANDLKCKYIKEQIIAVDPENIIKNQGEKGSMWITFGDLTIPRIFSNSSLSDKKLKNFNMFIKQAISLGRFKQNPLAEILQLWHEDVNKNNCLSIPLHPLQKMVNKNKLADALEMESIKVTNGVGIEINKAYEFSHLRGMLQFISGLGPRKASYLMDRLLILKGLQMRMQLLTNALIGKKIFINCSAFFKIKTQPDTSDSKRYNLLDMTRIHPESYPLSNTLTSSAVDDDSKENEDFTLALLRDPKKFNMLELKDYIKKIEEKSTGSIKIVIGFIINEFNYPFKDPRPPHKDLTPSEIFYLLVGDENIRPGHIVLARVVRVDSAHVKCRLLNDLEATVWIKHIFEDENIDTYREQEMKEKYKEGMLFEARIKSINENSFKVDLETKPSIMSSHKNSMQVHLDKYFKLLEEDYVNKSYKEESKLENRKYIPRNIKHPAFKNITFVAAIEYLRSRETGDYLFRPSSKGVNNITLTWNFYRHVYSHIDIVEEDKIPGATIGSKFRISNDSYFSIDEIVDRFVKPCDKLVKEIACYRKFYHTDSLEEFEKRLKDDKNKDPALVHYLLTILPEYPQYVILGYCPKINSVIKEYIKVKPRGLFFHGDYFSSIEDLVVWFKKNYGEESYREYLRKIKPPIVDERRRKEDPSEFPSIDFPSALMSDTFENNLGRSMSRSQMASDSNNRNAYNRDSNTNSYRPNNYNSQQSGQGSRDYNNSRGERFVGNKRERSQERDNFSKGKISEPTWGGSNNDKNATSGWGSSNDNKSNTGWGNSTSENNPNSAWGTSSSNDNNSNSAWGNKNDNNSALGNPETQISNSLPVSAVNNNEVKWGVSHNQKEEGESNVSWGTSENNFKESYKSNDNFKPRNDQREGRDNIRDGGRDQNKKKTCYNCNEEGHMGFECPTKSRESNNSKAKCFNCSEEGHMNRECPQPKRGGRGGRGRGRCDRRSPTSFRSPRNDRRNETNNDERSNQGWGSNPSNQDNTNWGNSSDNNSAYNASSNFKNETSTWGMPTTTTSNLNNFNDNQTSGWNNNSNFSASTGNIPVQESSSGWGNQSTNDNNSSWPAVSNDNPVKNNFESSSTNAPQGNPISSWGNSYISEEKKTDNNSSSVAWGNSENTNNWNNSSNNDNASSSAWGKPENKTSSSMFNHDFVNKNDSYSRPRDNQGGNRGGNFGGDRRRECFTCKQEGHQSRDCPNKQNDNNRKRACFNCKEEGHMANDCKKPRENKRACFICKDEGHIANDCPNKKQGDFNKKKGCFSCGEEGHISSNCPTKDRDSRGSRNYRGRAAGLDSPNRDNFRDRSGNRQSDRGFSNSAWANNDSNTAESKSGWGASNTTEYKGGWGSTSNTDIQPAAGSSINTETKGGWESSGKTDTQNTWGSDNNNQGGCGSTNNDANKGGWGSYQNNEIQGAFGSTNNFERGATWGSTTVTENQVGWGSSINNESKTSNPVLNKQSAFGSSSIIENQSSWGSENNPNNQGGWGSN